MKIVLRPMIFSDAKTFSSWAVDSRFCAQAGWRKATDIEDLVPWWQSLIAAPETNLLRMTAVFNKDIVGYVDLYGDSDQRRELGFLIGDSQRWGNGLGMSVANAGLSFGFQKLGLSSIWAEALEANVASVRILQKLGMSYTGRGEEDIFDGVRSVYEQYEMSLSSWLSEAE